MQPEEVFCLVRATDKGHTQAGAPVCEARTFRCRYCDYRFSREEHELWACPECGEDRHCMFPVREAGLRCKHHGGASLRGAASPRFITGRHSKYIPERLLERYEEARADVDLLAMRDEIALTDVRLSDLLQRVDSEEAGRHWARLAHVWEEYERAARRADEGGITTALDNLGHLITHGRGDYEAWAEVHEVVEARRRLVESERRMLVDLKQMITTERAMTLVAAIVGIIKGHIRDQTILMGISADIRELLNR